MLRITAAGAALVLTLAACSLTEATPAPSTTVDPRPPPVLTLDSDGLGDVLFGADPELIVAGLTPVIGAPSSDTGWMPGGSGIYGECPDPLRVISWGSLSTFHTGDEDLGTFFAYTYGFDFDEAAAGVDPRGLELRTAEGVGLDTTVAELERMPDVVLGGDEDIDVWTFAIAPETDPHLRGQVTGPDPGDTVLFIETSNGCS